MNQPKYPVVASHNDHMYQFFSEGPRGKIAKGVIYSKMMGKFFNLSFGDWIEESQELDDSNRSNNGDRDKVLTTVAFTALDFINKFPNAHIYAEGSTSARTRLYQMGIAANILEINKKVEVFGLLADSWESFQFGRNYSAFLIKRK